MTAMLNTLQQQASLASNVTAASLILLVLLIGLLVLREIARSTGGPSVRRASSMLPIIIGPLLLSFFLLLSLRLGSLLAE